jgi:hypothetical protein
MPGGTGKDMPKGMGQAAFQAHEKNTRYCSKYKKRMPTEEQYFHNNNYREHFHLSMREELDK